MVLLAGVLERRRTELRVSATVGTHIYELGMWREFALEFIWISKNLGARAYFLDMLDWEIRHSGQRLIDVQWELNHPT